MGKISIILTVWNGEKYLSEALESALNQDYLDKEILVVDDGSTDATQDVVKQFGKWVRLISHENCGLGASRNRAIEEATGDYFSFLDHDDLWLPNKLTKQMKILKSAKNDPLVFTLVKQFFCPTLSDEEKSKIIVNTAPLPGYIAGTLLISRKRLEQIGPFLEERKLLGEFIDWYLKALEKNVPMIMLQEVTLHRRVHQDNMGRRDLSRRTDYVKILKASLDRRRAL